MPALARVYHIDTPMLDIDIQQEQGLGNLELTTHEGRPLAGLSRYGLHQGNTLVLESDISIHPKHPNCPFFWNLCSPRSWKCDSGFSPVNAPSPITEAPLGIAG